MTTLFILEHKVVNHSAKEYTNNIAHTNNIESVQAVLKRDYNDIYHNFSRKPLQRHINKFTFRLNEGHWASEETTLAIAVSGKIFQPMG